MTEDDKRRIVRRYRVVRFGNLFKVQRLRAFLWSYWWADAALTDTEGDPVANIFYRDTDAELAMLKAIDRELTSVAMNTAGWTVHETGESLYFGENR